MAAAAKHNNGRSQVNFNSLASGEYPFINQVKGGTGWAPNDNTANSITPDMLDSNGYPTSLAFTGFRMGVFPPPQSAYSGDWIVDWTGNGTIALGFANTFVSGSLTGSGGTGAYRFNNAGFDGGQFNITITALPVTNLRLYRFDEATRLNAGEVFGIDFLARLTQANFGVLRFLNWNAGNTGNVTTWASRKSASYFSYNAYELRSAWYVGATTNSGTAFTSGVPSVHSSDGTTWVNGDVPKDKDTVFVKWNSDQASPTLKVGSSGTAKGVYTRYSQNFYNAAGSAGANGWAALGCLVFDATLNVWIARGGATNEGSFGLDNGVPYELMVQLAAEVGAHPWFSAPYLAIDPMTDFFTGLATYTRDNGPSWMKPWLEPPNELWNYGFAQTTYGDNKALAYGWANGHADWYGKVASTIGQAVSAVYSNDRTRYQMIIGVQTQYGQNQSDTGVADPKFLSGPYTLSTPQSGYTASAAKGWATHIAVANYMSPNDYNRPAEASWAVEYYRNGKQGVANQYCDTLMDAGDFTLHPTSLPTRLGWWKTRAQTHGVTKMAFYEGGYSPDYLGAMSCDFIAATKASQCKVSLHPDHVRRGMTGCQSFVGLYGKITGVGGMTELNGNTYPIVAVSGNDITLNVNSTGFTTYTSGGFVQIFLDSGGTVDLGNHIDNMRYKSKSHPALAAMLYANYQMCMDLNDATFTAEFPSCYHLGGPPSPTPPSALLFAWAVLEDLYQTPDPPQWTAIRNWNSARRAAPLRMRIHG